MSDILLVPIYLDALCLQRDTFVAEAVADFTRLPYFNGQRDVNPDIANISEDIVIEPFQDKNFNLKSGLHLHWALPDALTKTVGIRIVERETFKKAFGDDDGDGIWTQLISQEWIKEIDSSKASVMPIDQRGGNDLGSFEDWRSAIEAILSQPLESAFPPVPNRWLVERSGGGLSDKKWVIESDYLYPYGVSDPGSVNILYSAELFGGGNPEAIGILASNLKNSTPLSDWLRDQFLPETLDLLNEYDSGTPSPELQVGLMWELNEIMRGASIYTEERFSGIELSEEAQNLLDSHPQGEDLVRLNRLLLEAAYPECKGIGRQPFRYLGRKMSFANWLNQRSQAELYKESLDPLTAMGYGEPTFAAFYPNCHSVFGFYDGDVQSLPTADSDLKYTVVGWYESSDSDYFATFLKHYRNLYGSESSNADLLEALQEEFKWTLEIPEDGEFPEETLCYARIGFEPEANIENSDKDSATTIAVGNTSTEALSAYLAREIDSNNKSIIEDQLECLHLFAGLEHRKLDTGPKFEEARHESGVNAVNAGILWTIRYETDSDRKADAAKSNAQAEVTLPEEIGLALNVLNLKQQEYDRAWNEIESLQHHIFADWYKYILSAYPPDDSRDDYPDIDEVKHYIEYKGINPLNEKLKATGELRLLIDPTTQNLVLRRDGEGNVITAAASEADSIASELAAAINELLDRLDTYNQELRNSIIEDRILDSLDNNSDILQGSPTVVAEGPVENNCLSFDGESDYIQLSGLTNAKAVSLWLNIPNQQESGERYLLDAPGLENGQVAVTIEDINNQVSNIGAGWNLMYADGEEVGKRLGDLPLWQEIPKDRWVHIYLEAKTAFDGDIYIMSDRNGQNKLKAKIAAVRVYNRDLSEEEIERDRSNTIELNYILKRVPSPRYWQPNDPAILIEGDAAKFTERHGSDGRLHDEDLLECQFYENSGNAAIGDLIADYDNTIGPKIDALESETSDSIAFSNWTKQPWHPFLLEWEVEVLPMEHQSNLQPDTRAYDRDFILRNYDLEENATDLSVKPGTSPTVAANVSSGSSIVTPHAGIKLDSEIEGYLNEKNVLDDKSVMEQYFADTGETPRDDYLRQPGNIEKVKTWYEEKYFTEDTTPEDKAKDPIYTAIRAYQLLQNSHSFSQALGGFNAGLLMHKQTMQLRVDDPLGFEDYKSFAERVRLAVGDRNRIAPVPLNDFNPIRSGMTAILRLRLIDTFGQVKADLDPGQLVVTEKMTPPPDYTLPTGRDWLFLAPRLVQPSRLNFRWLSASQGEQESNSHPATSPICGWLLPNNLDNSLMVYDGLGNTLGSVDRQANWEPAPGSNVQVQLRDIANLYLRKVVERLTVELSDADEVKTRKRDFLNNLITVIDSSMEDIEPENFAQHQDLALLMGSPVAVVRASLNFELQGLPSINHGWSEFRQDLTREERDTDNFTQVQFPIRIGEYRQLNDGTIGYWQEGEDGSLSDDFYAAHNYGVEDEQITTENLYQTIGDRPHNLTLLMDPRAKVHATSGVLPSKAIDLPPDYYTEALNNIEITFLSVPILAEAYQIKLPLPKEAGYAWSWLEKNRYTWQEISTIGRIRKEVILAEFDDGEEVWETLIQQGWIVELDLIQAEVVPTDQRTDASLGEDMQDKEPKIEQILARSHIGAVNTNATFGDTHEIREGWLKLRKVIV